LSATHEAKTAALDGLLGKRDKQGAKAGTLHTLGRYARRMRGPLRSEPGIRARTKAPAFVKGIVDAIDAFQRLAGMLIRRS
jgi:hypothetical protein